MPFEATIDAFAARAGRSVARRRRRRRSGARAGPIARRFAVYRNNVAVGADRRARGALSGRRGGWSATISSAAMARAFVAAEKPRSPVLIHYGDDFPAFVAGFRAGAARFPISPTWRGSRTRGSRPITPPKPTPLGLDGAGGDRARRARRAALSAASRRRGCSRLAHPAASIWAAHRRARASRARPRPGRPRTRWSRGPTPTFSCAFCRRAASPSPRRCFPARRSARRRRRSRADGFDPGRPSRRPDRGRRVPILIAEGVPTMTTADAPSAPLTRANPIARFTDALFGWLPMSLAMLVLRFALARAVLEVRHDEMGRLAHAVLRRAAIVRRRVQAASVRRRISPFRSPKRWRRCRRSARPSCRSCSCFGLATRYAALGHPGDDGDHPTHRSRRLGQLPSAVGGDGAGDPDLRAGQDRARLGVGPGLPEPRPARLISGAFWRRARSRPSGSSPRPAITPAAVGRRCGSGSLSTCP